jgi:hypothetical protein
MKTLFYCVAIFFVVAFFSKEVYTQGVIISSDEMATPDPSAMLDVQSSGKGFLPPRMTTVERNNIVTPAEGLVVYDTNEDALFLFNGTEWEPLVSGSGSRWDADGDNIYRNTGNVGIGSTNPLRTLTIGGDTTVALMIGFDGFFNNQNSGMLAFTEDVGYLSGTCGFEFRHNGLTNQLVLVGGCPSMSDTALVINRNGRVHIPQNLFMGGRISINTAAPLADLLIRQSESPFPNPTTGGIRLENTNITSSYWHIWNSSNHLSFAYQGIRLGYIHSSSGAYVSTSDARMKDEVQELPSILSKVLKLRPVSYRFNHQSHDNKYIGLIAQEVQPLFPELVSGDEGGDLLGMSYGTLGVVAVKAIQEQQAVIDAQQEIIEDLIKRVAALEQKQ